MSIKLTPCESSRIAAHGYDAETQTLALQFKAKAGPGSIYHYAGFAPDRYEELLGCESIGKFFGSVVNAKDEDGKLIYPFTKIEPEKTE